MNKTLKDFIFPFELLDESTLTDALKSDNVELLKYLILNKKLKIEEYDHLALRTALIYGYKSYSYLITLKECQDYLKNNAQDIFNKIIVNKINPEKNKIKNQFQFQIAKYLYESYRLEINEMKYKSNNPKLINYLKVILIK